MQCLLFNNCFFKAASQTNGADDKDKVCEWVVCSKVFVVLGTTFSLATISLIVTTSPMIFSALTASAAVGCFALGIGYQEKGPISLLKRYSNWIRSLSKEALPEEFIAEKVADITAFYGTNFNEELLFGHENESALKIEIAKYLDLMRFRASPAEFIREKYKHMSLIEQLMPNVYVSIEKYAASATLKDLDALYQSLGQLRELVNIQALNDLSARLEGAVGVDLKDQIMADWDYIGKDIQDNSGVLTEARKLVIIEKAMLASQKIEQFESILEQLRGDLKQYLPPVEKIVFSKYKTLSALMEAMPSSKKQLLQQMLARAFLHQEIRGNARLKSFQAEAAVLQELGYNISGYDRKENTQQALRHIMKKMLDQLELESVDTLKIKLNKIAGIERLRSAGVKDEDIPRIHGLIKEYKLKKNEWILKAEAYESAFQERLTINLPKAKKRIIESFRAKNRRLIVDALNTALRQSQNLQKIELNESRFSVPDDKVQKAEAWFYKYQDNFISEFAQSENGSDECLAEGVCYALSVRMALQTLRHPELLAELHSILPSDRTLQAAYNIDFLKKKNYKIPSEILARMHLVEKDLFITDREGIRSAITNQMGRLGASQGGMILGYGAHATFFRFDHLRHFYSFVEPNFGTLKFKKSSDQTPKEVSNRMADCYTELYEWAYPSSTHLLATQLLHS